MPGALIAYSQVTQTTPPAGQAMLGVTGQVVTVANESALNAGIVVWTFTVLDVPPGSAVPTGVVQTGATATWTFTPDLVDCYSINLVTEDTEGNLYSDTRVFGVLRANGQIIPPFGADVGSINFNGTLLGWDPIMRSWLVFLNAQTGAGRTRSNTATFGAHPTMAESPWQVQPLNSSGGAFTLNLPPNPSTNDQIDFEDAGCTGAGTGLGANAVTLNGGTIVVQDFHTFTTTATEYVLGTPNDNGGAAPSIRFDGTIWRRVG
jgi:hypothetical protein